MPEGVAKEPAARVLPGWCATQEDSEGQRMGEGPWREEAI